MKYLGNEQHQQLVDLRHHIHKFPELAHHERETASHITDLLKKTQPDELLTGIGGSGIMAVYEGDSPGPSLMLRSELDALPISEPAALDIAYRSENSGISHKCGHDGHMSILAGVALVLGQIRPAKGKICLLFQPAEEVGEGAQKILDDPKFQQNEPDYMLALHNLPGYPINSIIVRDGIFAAASVGMKTHLRGDTSHAAHPEDGRSPALAVAQLINTISALPQFHVPLSDAAKATIIHARIGEQAFGTSPGEAEVMATLRAFENRWLDRMADRAEKLVKSTAAMYGLEYKIDWVEPFRATSSRSEINQHIRKTAHKMNLELVEPNKPFAWSEDFGRFTEKYEGALFGLGAGIDQPQLHASAYDFPDELIASGTDVFLGIMESMEMIKTD